VKVLKRPTPVRIPYESDESHAPPTSGGPSGRAASDQYVITFKQSVLDWELVGRRDLKTPAPGWPSVTSSDVAEDAVASILRRLPHDVLEEVLLVLAEAETEEIADTVWGRPPELGEVLSATLWHHDESRLRLESVVSQTHSVEQVASQLGVDAAKVHALIADGALSAVVAEGNVRLPRWQFDEEGQVRPGLAELVAAFPGSAVALAHWVEREHPDLGDSPRNALALGRQKDVIFAATRGFGIA
jgi:hypothetical protein